MKGRSNNPLKKKKLERKQDICFRADRVTRITIRLYAKGQHFIVLDSVCQQVSK